MKTKVSDDVKYASDLLRKNELVAIPTETVYGLAGNIYSETAIRAIFQMKGRPLYNPLIVHIASRDQLNDFVINVPKVALKLADTFWPGPMTLVLEKKDNVPDLITAEKPTVAVRIPNHQLTLKLLANLDFPVAAPSANPFGRISPTKASHVVEYFDGKLKMVLDGGTCTKGIESTIIGFENDKAVIFRLGSLSKDKIEQITGPIQLKNKAENNPVAPGMLSRHYAPKTPFVVVENATQYCDTIESKKLAVLKFQETVSVINNSIVKTIVLSDSGSFEEAASNLYNAMHELDSLKVDCIVAELFPNTDLGTTINDRLRRAAKT